MDRTWLLSVMRNTDRSLPADLARLGLEAAEPFYRLAVAARNRAFDWRWRAIHRLDRPVLSVGNLTTGGTGKTPMVIALTQRLQALGARPAVLLRGYKPGHTGSDEAQLLQAALGDAVPVEADADRVAGARRALQRRPDLTLFVLDDGFQHRQVARDLDLVLIDATTPFGGGNLLPRGFMREPASALRRAHAVILTRADQVSPERLELINANIVRRHGKPALAHAVHAWVELLDGMDQPVDPAALGDVPVAGVCGIGNPAAFKTDLARRFTHVTGLYELGDHQDITPAMAATVLDHSHRQGAKALLMTEKDWVKWRHLPPLPHPMPIYRPRLELRFVHGQDALDLLLRQFLAQSPASSH